MSYALESLKLPAAVTRDAWAEAHVPELIQHPELANEEPRIMKVQELVGLAALPELAEETVDNAGAGDHGVASGVPGIKHGNQQKKRRGSKLVWVVAHHASLPHLLAPLPPPPTRSRVPSPGRIYVGILVVTLPRRLEGATATEHAQSG